MLHVLRELVHLATMRTTSSPLPAPLFVYLNAMSQSVGAQFKNQLNHLLGAIGQTHPHYVRCLKPNDENIRSNFNRTRITSQLANGGIFVKTCTVCCIDLRLLQHVLNFILYAVHFSDDNLLSS